ncbi:hypothetical protein C5167_006631 [Papaver somniferum]|uniref:Uncharacterized protein n=1 Tax=Papaver somniferum TaxID=3469 RepID=A0A4Y7JHU7_PAPSO|nr:hypothetical protein C5167_006631 [Papaver somniferum]
MGHGAIELAMLKGIFPLSHSGGRSISFSHIGMMSMLTAAGATPNRYCCTTTTKGPTPQRFLDRAYRTSDLDWSLNTNMFFSLPLNTRVPSDCYEMRVVQGDFIFQSIDHSGLALTDS